jgi:uncharacterized surface protein with fasciclin (FAS1) repeats
MNRTLISASALALAMAVPASLAAASQPGMEIPPAPEVAPSYPAETPPAPSAPPAPDMPPATPADTPPPATTGAADTAQPAANIVETLAASPQFSTLAQAVTAADLASTLAGTGPFTVFAPPNSAFALLPEAQRTTLMQPANKDQLATILKYHVLAGNVTAAQIAEQIRSGGGTATLRTVAGPPVTARMDGEMVVLTGADGRSARVTQGDVRLSNGIVHVIDAVLVPAR